MKILLKLFFLGFAIILSCKNETKKDVITKEEKVITIVDSNGVKKQDSTVVFNRTVDGKSIVKKEVKKYIYNTKL
jgi:hypothetical protein